MDLQLAFDYLRAGLSVLPAMRDGAHKRVALRSWKMYQSRLPTEAEVRAWFANDHQSLCLVCGKVSGNLELIDFDLAGEAFEPWARSVREMAPGLLDRLVIETTPSGGKHVIYRCETAVCGNLKLATRKIAAPAGSAITIGGKTFQPRADATGTAAVLVTLIETRGEGGIFLCDPSPGYTLTQGKITSLPVLTTDEREMLLSAAWALNEVSPEPEPVPAHSDSPTASGLRPGDDFNERGDVPAILLKHGWTLVKRGDNQYWRRPGRSAGWSATLRERVFYVFSSSAAPFEPSKAYGPFAVYTHLEHHGDFAAAARALRAQGFGDDSPQDNADLPDLSALMPTSTAASPSNGILGPIVVVEEDELPAAPEIPDPGPIPPELLRIPGFVSEVMDHTLNVAAYPNPVMAFAGALALMAFLAGRKVRDPGDNRTNIYLLGLAHSSAGKDWPRKTNTRVMHEIGLANCLGDHFASGEGIQDALFQSPSMLLQTDEIDGMLQSINKAKDARYEAVMSSLLTMYSSASSIFSMRRKAGKESPGVIDQPNLVIFGTAIPTHYYQALSERMLTNGFFARMIIVEAGPRGTGQEPRICDLPERILATAKWWADYQPGTGNLQEWHPVPKIIEQTEPAKRLLVETRLEAEAEYSQAESRNDSVGTTVWGRVSEQTRKLALIYAISENHLSPCIGLEAVRWASRFVMHQTRRMLFMAAGHVAENPFHAECLKAVEKLRNAPGHVLTHSVLLKRMKTDAKSFASLIETLCQQGDIQLVTAATAGRTQRAYRLTEGVKEASETSVAGERC